MINEVGKKEILPDRYRFHRMRMNIVVIEMVTAPVEV